MLVPCPLAGRASSTDAKLQAKKPMDFDGVKLRVPGYRYLLVVVRTALPVERYGYYYM